MKNGLRQLWSRAGKLPTVEAAIYNIILNIRLVFSEESEGKEVEGEPAAN